MHRRIDPAEHTNLLGLPSSPSAPPVEGQGKGKTYCVGHQCIHDIMHMCIDYRKLNKVMVKNCYPISRSDDLFNKI